MRRQSAPVIDRQRAMPRSFGSRMVRRRGTMRRMKYGIPFAAMSLAACAASAPLPVNTAAPPASARPSVPGDLSGRTLGVSLYDQLKSQPGDLLFSPVSIMGVFGVVTAGAKGHGRDPIGSSLLHSES